MLKDKFKQKRLNKKQDEMLQAAPIIEALPVPIVELAPRLKPYSYGNIKAKFPLIAADFARLRMEEKKSSKTAFLYFFPEAKTWTHDRIMQFSGALNKSDEVKEAVKILKNAKLAKAKEIINKKLKWSLEESTETLAFLIKSTKEIIEEDLQVKFRTTVKGNEWLYDPDGNKIQKKRYLSDSAVRGLIEATKELNKIYGLTKGEAPTENRYTQINYINSELKE